MQPKLELLKSTLPYRALENLRPPLTFKNPPIANHTPVFVTGGIGDTIISVGVCEALNKKVGDVVVYTKYEEAAKIFTDLPVLHEREITKKGFDWLINMNCISNFQFSHNFQGFKNSKVEQVFLDCEAFRKDGWDDFVVKHPWLDGLMAEKAVAEGLNRVSLAHKFLGLEPCTKNVYIEDSVPLPKRPYITVHDGFDETHLFKGRSMKNWDLQHWADFIKDLKSQMDILVVQLGGANSRVIRSADIKFTGVLSFRQSMKLLSRSMLHIDGDSGLVHAAHRLGVSSMVLFGPTNWDFFGYRDNINLKPRYCGGCWWLTKDWMQNCAMGHASPECMDSHDPEHVAACAYNFLTAGRRLEREYQRELEEGVPI